MLRITPRRRLPPDPAPADTADLSVVTDEETLAWIDAAIPIADVLDQVASGAAWNARVRARSQPTEPKPHHHHHRDSTAVLWDGDDRPRYRERRRRQLRMSGPAPLRTPAGAADNFDEFGDQQACGNQGGDRDRTPTRGSC